MGADVTSGTVMRAALATLAAVLIAATFLLTITIFGQAALPIFGLALLAGVVVQRPKVALALVLVPTVLIEDSSEGGLFPGLAPFYDAGPVSPFEALIALSVAATALDVARRRGFRSPDPLTLSLLLIIIAIVSGALVGMSNGASLKDVSFTLRPLLPLILMPFVIVNTLRDRETIIAAMRIGAGLIALKSILGILSVVIGSGFENPGDPGLTYLSPTANWLALVALLVAGVVLWRERKLDPWLLACSLLTFTSLLLSYRRSFWIAAVVGIVIVLVVGAGRRRWHVVVPGLAMVLAALWLTLSSGVVGGASGPVATRAASLAPSEIEANAQDRYRNGERRNVITDLRENPVTGLGLAVPWTGRYPLSIDYSGSRDYVHFTALWWWLKLGFLGVIAYSALILTSFWTAYRVWKEAADPLIRCLGLGLVGALLGLALAETTGAFTGVTTRFSVTIAAVLGLLVAAYFVSIRVAPLAGGELAD